MVPQHDGKPNPKDADFFAPADPRIGPLRSAESTASSKGGLGFGCGGFLLSLVAAPVGFLLTMLVLTGGRLDVRPEAAPIGILVGIVCMFATLIVMRRLAPWQYRVSYLGTEGFQISERRGKAVTTRVLAWSDVADVRVACTRRVRPGSMQDWYAWGFFDARGKSLADLDGIFFPADNSAIGQYWLALHAHEAWKQHRMHAAAVGMMVRAP